MIIYLVGRRETSPSLCSRRVIIPFFGAPPRVYPALAPRAYRSNDLNSVRERGQSRAQSGFRPMSRPAGWICAANSRYNVCRRGPHGRHPGGHSGQRSRRTFGRRADPARPRRILRGSPATRDLPARRSGSVGRNMRTSPLPPANSGADRSGFGGRFRITLPRRSGSAAGAGTGAASARAEEQL